MKLLRNLMICSFIAIAGVISPALAQVDSLSVIDNQLRRDFPEIESIKAADLQALLLSKPEPIILDVREADEYAVSHLKGAIRVAPNAELNEVMRQIGGELQGRTLIVYCSVGVRSTKLATRLRAGLRKNGAERIANLSEGIFGWHNSKRPLVASSAATPFVHPYNEVWGQLVERKALTRYRSVGSPGTPPDRVYFPYLGVLLGALGLSGVVIRLRQSRR
jgi:rhodanese-related sulfurtransferase